MNVEFQLNSRAMMYNQVGPSPHYQTMPGSVRQKRQQSFSGQTQSATVPPAASAVRLFSKKLLQTSDLATRFLFAVSNTELAQKRKKQREKPSDEAAQQAFTIIGSEIIGTKVMKMPSSIRMASESHPGNSPGCHPPSLSCSCEAINYIPLATSASSSIRERNETVLLDESSSFPYINTANFFPRRHQLQNKTPRVTSGNIGTILLTKSVGPSTNSGNANNTLNYSSFSSHSSSHSPSPQMYLRSGRLLSASKKSKPSTSNNRSSQAKQLAREEILIKAVPNITLYSSPGIKPTVVPPPVMSKVRPWNWPRSFSPTSPLPSRSSTAAQLLSRENSRAVSKPSKSLTLYDLNSTSPAPAEALNSSVKLLDVKNEEPSDVYDSQDPVGTSKSDNQGEASALSHLENGNSHLSESDPYDMAEAEISSVQLQSQPDHATVNDIVQVTVVKLR